MRATKVKETGLNPDVDEVSLSGEFAECDGGAEVEMGRPRGDPRHVAPRHRGEAPLVRFPPRLLLTSLPVRESRDLSCYLPLHLNLYGTRIVT